MLGWMVGGAAALIGLAAAAARRGTGGPVLVHSGGSTAQRTDPRKAEYVIVGREVLPVPKEPIGVVAEGKFTGRFGVKRSASHIHKGIDISAQQGTPIRAINQAEVIGVYPDGQRYGYGNSLLLKHPDGKYSFYAHLHSIDVRQGQHVAQGQMIGTVGATQKRIRGGAVQPNPRPHMPPHLHMEVQTNIAYNPSGVPIIGEDVPSRMDPLIYMNQVNAKPVQIERTT